MRASADDAKRGFLERKGLTAAEIAEAFSRVSSLPAPPASAALAPYSAGTETLSAHTTPMFVDAATPQYCRYY